MNGKQIWGWMRVTVIGVGLAVSPVWADTVTWTGLGADGNWSTPDNWSTTPNLPEIDDDVIIGSGWGSGNITVGGTEGTPIVVNSLELRNDSADMRSIGGASSYLQLTSGTINRPTLAKNSTIVLGARKLYLPAGTNNWLIDASSIWWTTDAIEPIGGTGRPTISKTGAGTIAFARANLRFDGDWDYTGVTRLVATNCLGSGTFTWRGEGVMEFDTSDTLSNTFIFDTGWRVLYTHADAVVTFAGTLTNLASGTKLSFNGRDYGSQTGTIVLSGTNSLTSPASYVIPLGVLRLDAPGMLKPVNQVTFGWNTLGWGNLVWNVAETATNAFVNQAAKNGYHRLTMNTNGTTTLTGQYSLNNNAAQGSSLELSAVAGGTLVLAGPITDQRNLAGAMITSSTNRALIKLGVGTVILSGANDYQGGTMVSNGTLRVANTAGSATGTNTVQVSSGATLGGSGMIAGPVTINAGGSLMPGTTNATANLTVDNSVTFVSSATNVVNVLADSNDTLTMTGTLALDGATLQVVLPAGFRPPATALYTIASGFSELTGTFSGLAPDTQFSAGGVAFVIRYNTGTSPKTITLRPVYGTVITVH